MIKKFIKEVVVNKAALLFSDSIIGRALLRKGVSLISHKVGLPMDVQPDTTPNFWLIRVGETEANLCVTLRAQTQTLIELIEFAADAYLNNKKLKLQDILPILQPHMRAH